MKITGEKIEPIVKPMYKLVGIKCDICGRVIDAPSKKDRCECQNNIYKFFEVCSGNYEFGNSQHRDICPDCIGKFVDENLNGKESYQSGYIEIYTRHISYDEITYNYK